MSKAKTIIVVIVSIIVSLLIVGFLSYKHILVNDRKVSEVYDVYLDGELIGTIRSKSKLEKYIDSEQSDLKKEYGVKKVYIPNGIDVKKVMRYDSKLVSEKEIYKIIKSKKSFSITISPKENKDLKEEDSEEELALDETGQIQNEDIVLYVLKQGDFDKAVKNVLYVFENKDNITKYVNKTQKKIETTGSIIENVYLDQDVTIKEAFISTDERIFTDVSDLTKYLLFGNLSSREDYTVAFGDTIESIAYDHKLNVDEFLIVNPEFTSKNNLLTIGQTVNVALISPIVRIVVEKTEVTDEDKMFETINKEDNTMYVGKSKVEVEGENGIQRITAKVQYINGAEQPAYIMNSVVIKEPVNKVVLVGTKSNNYYTGGTPAITTGIWGWPTISPYKITSPFGYRWGRFHQGIDISGTGFGSPIYAIGEGTVLETNSSCPDQGYYGSSCGSGYGNYVWIRHNENVYVVYSHIAGKVLVSPGQTVSKGQQVGYMANSGSSTGTHLHFGTYYGGTQYGKYGGGKAFNPLELYK